jgi:hypothetical protein
LTVTTHDLAKSDFTGASLRLASFRDADLRGVRFENVDLTGAALDGAVTDGAMFVGAVVDRAVLPEATWREVASALHSWASHGKEIRVEVTGPSSEQHASALRAFRATGIKDVMLVAEGLQVFIRGLSVVR